MARAKIPNFNFTIPLEERIKATQGLPAFIRRSRRLEVLMHQIELEMAEFHSREMKPVVKGLKEVAALLRLAAHGRRVRRPLKGALRDLSAGIRTYNRRRAGFLKTLDLSPLNREIENFHSYYVIERDAWCVTPLRPEVMSRWRPLSLRDLEDRLPPLLRP